MGITSDRDSPGGQSKPGSNKNVPGPNSTAVATVNRDSGIFEEEFNNYLLAEIEKEKKELEGEIGKEKEEDYFLPGLDLGEQDKEDYFQPEFDLGEEQAKEEYLQPGAFFSEEDKADYFNHETDLGSDYEGNYSDEEG